MAALASAHRAGKDAFLDALSNTEEARRHTDNAMPTPGDRSASDEEETDDEEAEMRAFLEASDSEKENDLLREVEAMKEHEAHSAKTEKVLTQYRSHAEVTRILAHQKVLKANEQLQHDYAAKVTAAEDAQEALRVEEDKLRGVHKEAKSGTLKDPSRIAFHEREVEKAWARLTQAEKQRDLAELDLHNRTEIMQVSAGEHQRDNLANATISHERQADEVRRARSQIARHAERVEAAEELAFAHKEEAERREAEAAKHHLQGKQRLRQMQASHGAVAEEVEKVREARHSQDAKRILDLKASINRINGDVRGQNERRRKKDKKTRKEQDQRKQDLLDAGQNPYEVFRREEIEASKAKQKTDLESKRELRADKLLVQLMEEDRRYRNKVKVRKEREKLIDTFQKEMGNYAREKRVAAYIRKVTVGNVDVLDPTATALRLDPSKVTVQKTHAFGLGSARPEELAKVNEAVAQANKRMETWKTPDEDLLPPSPQGMDVSTDPGSRLSLDDPDSDKLWVPKLTKLEEQYLAAARERQKQNICTVQRCWGKEFKGDAFLAKPSIITFADFEVGKKYRQVVEVTNVSLTFNQFKLLPLEDRIKDFFEIEFLPPGRMSAGVTRYITIWFHPKVPTDISTTFPILAKTGRIDFPLRCITKKTILTITPQDADANPVVDFGQVLDGESGDCSLKVKNAGALAANFTLEPLEAADENPFLGMLTWPPMGSFTELATSIVKFTFTPALSATGAYEAEFKLSLSNGAPGDAKFVEERRVLVRGRCIDTPIYVEKDEYNLNICLFDHIVRENVVLHNRQSVAMKVQVEEPRALEGELFVNPTLAYVQGQKSQNIQVKFCPKEDFLQKYPQFRDTSRREEAGAFRIPVRVVGVDQVLPICTQLVGTLSVAEVTVEPSVVSFGTCFVGFSAVQNLRIINHSLLPQHFAFMQLPSCLTVKDIPSDILDEEVADPVGWAEGSAVIDGGSKGTFGTLLPKEIRNVSVIYSPDSATELQESFNFKIITGGLCAKVLPVSCRGQGKPPPLKLSHTQIRMSAIPTGVICKESIEITNMTSVPQTMNLMLPPAAVSGLTASPVCYTLQPKERTRLQLDFKASQAYVNLFEPPPPPPAEEVKEEEAAPPPPVKGGKAAPAKAASPPEEPVLTEEQMAEAAAAAAAAAEAEAAAAAERADEHRKRMLKEIRTHGGRRWEAPAKLGMSVHATWKLPICVKPKIEGKQSASTTPAMLYVGLDTCVMPTSLAVEPKVLDFGEVTAQQRVVLPITLTSQDAEVLEQGLHVGPLPEPSCFKVLNAPRPVGSSKPFQLMVEFNPAEAQIYESVLQLYSIHDKSDGSGLQGPVAQVPLRGKGVRPVLKIQPENGILQLGAVIHTKESDNYVTAQLTVINDSPFDLNYKLETEVESEKDERRVQPFRITPVSGIVKGNEQKAVTITFRPHCPSAMFREKVLVNVPNQKEPTYVYLFGHCFTYQVYAMYDMDFSPFKTVAGSLKDTSFKGPLAIGTGSTTDGGGDFAYRSAQERLFRLQFEKGEKVKCLLVGSCVPPGTPKAPQNTPAQTFDFQIEQSEFSSLFTVEAPEGGGKPDKQVKGQVQAGKAPIRVAFRYNPPADSALSVGGTNLDLLDGIGQWVTVRVRGVLAGGYVPPPNPPNSNQEIVVELKAYLQQI
mmetsp:Transcript_45133/g.107346  ORF Transcript_45133/g.107346 Transcript_45133/m.107346 type:complete len:1663 (+) Transcript_45133:129-5117(+)